MEGAMSRAYAKKRYLQAQVTARVETNFRGDRND